MTDLALSEIRRDESTHLETHELVVVGVGAGLLGGVALAAPLVVWDWRHPGHLAFELPMAATAWLFGLQHFSHDRYLAWSVVIGALLLAAYAALGGIAFAALADRVGRITRPLESLLAGFGWGFVSFIFFWDMVLPIARGGAPFRAAPGAAGLAVAPAWVWILGFTLLGLVTGACYAALRPSPVREEATGTQRGASAPVERAA